MDDNKMKVVGQSLQGNTGSLTVSIPIEQLREYQGNGIAVGSWSQTTLGERYGLRSDSQSMSIPSERKKQIDLARDLYMCEPIVANVIDLFVDFCMTGFENRCEDSKSKKYYDGLCKYGDFDYLHRQMFKEYFISSDVFVLRGRKHTLTDGPDKGTPYFDYTVLNPKFIEVEGPLLFDAAIIGIRPTTEVVSLVKSGKDKEVLRKIPVGLKKAAEKGTLYVPENGTLSRISRKRSSYERYATPFLSRIFEPVLIKRRMREADLAVSETIKQVLITFTIGSDEFPATQVQLDALADTISTPSKTMELIWNHTLKVEYHYPSADLLGNTKYEQVNQDILQGLGVPPVLLDGGGGTFATAWTSLLSVMERLESVRNEVARWQESEYRRIYEAEKLKFSEIPSVSFKPLNLRDDKTFINLLLELYDRGLISIDTVLSLSPVDLDILVEARNRTAEKNLEDVFMPRQKPSNDLGRPDNKVSDNPYTPRDKTPPIDNDSTDNEPPKS